MLEVGEDALHLLEDVALARILALLLQGPGEDLVAKGGDGVKALQGAVHVAGRAQVLAGLRAHRLRTRMALRRISRNLGEKGPGDSG